MTASYNDGHGQGTKTLSATSEFATAATRASNTPPMFPDPLFTGVQTGLSVRENAGVRTVVGVAPEATDMQGGALRYSLAVSGFTSDPPFGINPSSRQIRVVRAVLNHEDQDSYSVTVTVVDEFDATATATFDITIRRRQRTGPWRARTQRRPGRTWPLPSASSGTTLTRTTATPWP